MCTEKENISKVLWYLQRAIRRKRKFELSQNYVDNGYIIKYNKTMKYITWNLEKNEKMKMDKFDEYEKDILASYERDEWVSVDNLEEIKEEYAQYARDTFLKNKRINIRISEKDFIDIKTKSLEEGIPYQTLIASIIHKFVSGKLVENYKYE